MEEKVSFMPRPVYPGGKSPRLLDRRLGVHHVDLDAVVRAKILLLPEIKPGCPARSPFTTMDALLYKVSWGITIYCSYPVYLPKE
jgi:hypothetical protein